MNHLLKDAQLNNIQDLLIQSQRKINLQDAFRGKQLDFGSVDLKVNTYVGDEWDKKSRDDSVKTIVIDKKKIKL